MAFSNEAQTLLSLYLKMLWQDMHGKTKQKQSKLVIQSGFCSNLINNIQIIELPSPVGSSMPSWYYQGDFPESKDISY